MPKPRSELPVYNDGVVEVYAPRERKTDFNAARNVASAGDLGELVVTLAFYECSMRTQDLEFAEQKGFSLSYKVKTPYYAGAQAKHKAVIGHMLYDIAHIDKAGREMYLYLEGVREI